MFSSSEQVNDFYNRPTAYQSDEKYWNNANLQTRNSQAHSI